MEFLQSFYKNSQISNLMKIRPVGAEFFMRTDGQTDGYDENKSHLSQF